jgi:hypothetical protein
VAIRSLALFLLFPLSLGAAAQGHAGTEGAPARTFKVVVVPMRYRDPPSASAEAMAEFNKTLPAVTQADAEAAFVKVAAWWSTETYDRQRLDVTVLPPAVLPGNPGCDVDRIIADTRRAASAVKFDVLVAILPYSCWSSHMITAGNTVISWNSYTNEPGHLAHELGHAFGLLHNALRMPDYVPYGSSVDQMGRVGSGLVHFLSDHKERLGVLVPKPCASATLRSIYKFPDAIRCGDYFADYLDDWGQVWIHKRENTLGKYSSDTTDVAKLSAGQTYNADGRVITHVGGGKVTVSR